MEKKSKISWSLFMAIALLIPLCVMGIYYYYDRMIADLPYYTEGNQKVDIAESSVVADFSFVNQDSVEVNSSMITNKIWVANYFFSVCPTICPPMMTNLKKVQNHFGEDDRFRMISLTVDPVRDVPSVLHKYAIGREINTAHWQLLTGEKKDLYRFARKELYIEATEGASDDDFFHSEKIVLVDDHNHIRGYYDGTDKADMELLIKHIERLLNLTN